LSKWKDKLKLKLTNPETYIEEYIEEELLGENLQIIDPEQMDNGDI